MAELVQTLVDSIQSEGAIDLDDNAVLRVLDRRHKVMVARAEAQRSSRTVTPVVAGSEANGLYALPADLVRLEHVLVGVGTGLAASFGPGLRYTAARYADLVAAYGASGIVIDGDGIYARGQDTTEMLWIYPAVAVTSNVVAVGTFRPATLTLGGTVFVDDEALEGLMAGVFASLLSRPGESRPDLAVPQEQVFSAACEEYRARALKRLYGKGPAQIRIQGVNA